MMTQNFCPGVCEFTVPSLKLDFGKVVRYPIAEFAGCDHARVLFGVEKDEIVLHDLAVQK